MNSRKSKNSHKETHISSTDAQVIASLTNSSDAVHAHIKRRGSMHIITNGDNSAVISDTPNKRASLSSIFSESSSPSYDTRVMRATTTHSHTSIFAVTEHIKNKTNPWDSWSWAESETPVSSSVDSNINNGAALIVGEADAALSDGDESECHESKSFSCS